MTDRVEQPTSLARKPLDIAKFEPCVCPGCRGLRGVASLACAHCGSTSQVTADA